VDNPAETGDYIVWLFLGVAALGLLLGLSMG